VAKIAESSAKVAVVLSGVGRSLVCIRYRMGPKTLPCGTPASDRLLILLERVYQLDMILIFCNIHGELCF
jgi:hypothetical protein